MPRPIATINPLVGDDSFVARFGRPPSASDDETERIATHLAFAERALRAADVSHLGASRRRARATLLAELRAYIAARRFPLPEATRGRLPAFVDREGTRCAVAALVDRAAGARATERIDARFHAAFVADIVDDALAALAADGLSRDELALIQPTYAPPPPALEWHADATVEAAADSAPGDHPVLALVGGGVGWHARNRGDFVPEPIVALDGQVGIDSSARVPYAASARAGAEVRWLHAHRVGLLAGVRVDADGSRVPRAWTVPIDAYWYVPWLGGGVRAGLVGGVRVQVAGADRPLGWTAGVDVMAGHAHVGLAVERVADLTLLSLTVGRSSRDRD